MTSKNTLKLATGRNVLVPKNPLVNDGPSNTLVFCVAVLEFLRTRTMIDIGGEYNDEITDKMSHGRDLLYQLVEDAIEYESSRLSGWSAP